MKILIDRVCNRIVRAICRSLKSSFSRFVYTFHLSESGEKQIFIYFFDPMLFLSDRISVYVRNYLRVPQEQQKNHSLLWFPRIVS